MGSPSNALNISQAGLVYFDGAYSFDGRVPVSTNSTIGISVGATTIDFTALVTSVNTITGNSGGPESPSAGNFNILGTGSITVVGSANTETIQLTGLTNHNLLIGAGTATITNVAPSATSGVPVISQGAAADPTFGTAVVAGGGTGRVTLTNHGVLVGAGTTAITQLAAGSAGQVLQSGGASADPAYSTASYPSTSGTTGTILRSNGTNFVNTSATYPSSTTANQILYSSATNVIGQITTAVNRILTTDASGVPSLGVTLNNDFLFTSSTSGSGRSVTVQHTNNSSGNSAAFINIASGGTSGGDPFVQYAVGATRSYGVGIDNSDTQSYVINTSNDGSATPSSGTQVLRMSNAGNMSLPLNSCVTADLNTGLTNATGDGTFINPLIFDTDTGSFFDQNSNYDTTTGIFTAPATGKYLVNATVTFNGIGALHTAGIVRVDLNGGAYCINNFNPALTQDANNTVSVPISCILPVAATGTIAILAQVSGSTKTVGIKGNTSGSFTHVSIVLVS